MPMASGRTAQVFLNNCAACHTGGANVLQAEKTLQKDALVQYLDGGFKVESIVTQVRHVPAGPQQETIKYLPS